MVDKIKDLISKGKTKQAIDELLTYTKQNDKKDLFKEAVIQSARYENYAQKARMGTTSNSEDGISIAKINKAVLDISDRFSIDDISVNSPQLSTASSIDSPPKGRWWKWIVGLGLLIAVIAWIVGARGNQKKDFFTSTSTASNTVTVLAHGEKGKDELILPHRGIVKLIYGDAIILEQINGKGEATFKQVNDAFFEPGVKVEILFHDPEGEPYRAVKHDSLYELVRGKYIPLEVHLLGLGEVTGIVKDSNTGNLIKGARVSIQREETYSNEHGEFTLEIPEKKQKKFQTIRVFKEGYQSYEMSDIPIQTQKEIPVFLKSLN